MNRRILFVFLIATLMTGGAAVAHHGTFESYDVDKTVTFSGKVTKYRWANPHSQLFWEVMQDGKPVLWGGELHSIALLTRAGMTKGLIQIGDTVEVTGNPSRAGTPFVVVTKIVHKGVEYFR